jgi:hypothetical protein
LIDPKKVITIKELRDFGILLGLLIPLLFGLLIPYLRYGGVNLVPVYIGVPFFVFGIVFPGILKYPYMLWMKIGEVLGWVNTRIILGIVFYLLFAPIGIFRRILGKDSLSRKLDKEIPSYRVVTEPKEINRMERPF